MAARTPIDGQERGHPVQWKKPLDAFDEPTDRELVRHHRSQVEELQANPPASLVAHLSDLEKETFSYHDEDTKRREAAVRELVSSLLTKLKEKEIFRDATEEEIGSHWAGTRVSKTANEFDFLVKMRKRRYVDADTSSFQLCEDIGEVMPTLILPEGLTHASLLGNKYRSVTRNQPACTMSLLWQGKDLITVDVSVGILQPYDELLAEEQVLMKRLCDKAGISIPDIFLIPAKVEEKKTTSLMEKQILRKFRPQSRIIKCIRMFKLFCRLYLHWGPTEKMVGAAHSTVDRLREGLGAGIVGEASVEEGGIGERGAEAEGAVGGAAVSGAVAVAGTGRGSVVHGEADVIADVKDWGHTLGIELGDLERLVNDSLSEGTVQELPDKGNPTYQSRLAVVVAAVSSRHLGQSHYHADCTLCTSLKEFSMVEQEEYLHPALAEVLNESVKPWISVNSVYCKYLAFHVLMESDESDLLYWKGSEQNAEKERRVLGEWIDRLLSDMTVGTDRGVEHPIFGDTIRPLSYRIWPEKRYKKAWEVSKSTFHECVLMLNKIREILVNQTTKHEK